MYYANVAFRESKCRDKCGHQCSIKIDPRNNPSTLSSFIPGGTRLTCLAVEICQDPLSIQETARFASASVPCWEGRL